MKHHTFLVSHSLTTHRRQREMQQHWDRFCHLLTVGLLVSGAGSRTSKLLGLVPPGVGNQQRPVKLHKDVLDLLLGLLVNVLLVVGDQGLGQRLSDGIHLASVSATLDTDPDVNIGKPVLAKEQDGLLQLEAQSLGLDKLQRATIHLDQSLSALAISHSSGRLLAPEDLDRLDWLLSIVSHD